MVTIISDHISHYGAGSAFAIVCYIWIKKNRQKMRIMNIVWPVNAGFPGFLDIGRRKIGLQSVKKSVHNKRCSTRSSNINNYSTIISRKCKKNMKKANFTKSVHRINPLCNRCTLGDVVGE